MTISKSRKEFIKALLKKKLCNEKEIQKIVLFGSFLSSEEPNDIDVAVFQDSDEKYLPLAMKYRKLVREIAKILPVDVIPLKSAANGTFLREIEAGEIIYEK
ncbi:Nucleotidyltransferase domain-containing protein [Candidatus Electrothrix aarhusensis]|jgi:predicted nucleotidyltransferase|uniref:Nucleotidyltransferase domain-containing protein n=1 Tax=Candidatus Electrothrix aarhusensis TaxID=1859131 RepID=A0A444J1U4_9BACT|nr:Nucleotidyltransferase domain-containing protein [Candidatus Electrothrix aarhusensis]